MVCLSYWLPPKSVKFRFDHFRLIEIFSDLLPSYILIEEKFYSPMSLGRLFYAEFPVLILYRLLLNNNFPDILRPVLNAFFFLSYLLFFCSISPSCPSFAPCFVKSFATGLFRQFTFLLINVDGSSAGGKKLFFFLNLEQEKTRQKWTLFACAGAMNVG